MVAAVVAGRNYYLKVYGYGNSVNPDYDLAIDGPAIAGDRFEPNDSLGWAWNLGVGPKLEEHLSIHATNNADCYAWTATANGEVHVALAFNHSLGDVDMEMYWDDQVGQGYQFLQSSTSAQDHEDIWQLVEAGENYLIRVYGYNGATNPDYALSITGTPTTIAADGYEPNGSREFASRLGTGDHTLTNLTIHTAGDSDYYRWTAPAAGVLNVDALFLHAIGDLDLEVYDTDQPGATPAAASRSADDNEHVALAVDQGHTYFIRVFGFNGAPDGKVDVVDLGILATNWQKGVGNPLGLPLDLSAFGLAWSGESAEPAPLPPAPQVRITADRKTGVLTPGIGAVDFGTVLVSSRKPGPRRTLRVTNTGDGVLSLRLRKLPKGFTLVEPLDLHLMPGESDTFTVAMLRKAVARHSRTVIHLDTNDPDRAVFDIPLTGVVRRTTNALTLSESDGPGFLKQTTGARATAADVLYVDAVFYGMEPETDECWICIAQPVQRGGFRSGGWRR